MGNTDVSRRVAELQLGTQGLSLLLPLGEKEG